MKLEPRYEDSNYQNRAREEWNDLADMAEEIQTGLGCTPYEARMLAFAAGERAEASLRQAASEAFAASLHERVEEHV